jgi:hypothetical protein
VFRANQSGWQPDFVSFKPPGKGSGTDVVFISQLLSRFANHGLVFSLFPDLLNGNHSCCIFVGLLSLFCCRATANIYYIGPLDKQQKKL